MISSQLVQDNIVLAIGSYIYIIFNFVTNFGNVSINIIHLSTPSNTRLVLTSIDQSNTIIVIINQVHYSHGWENGCVINHFNTIPQALYHTRYSNVLLFRTSPIHKLPLFIMYGLCILGVTNCNFHLFYMGWYKAQKLCLDIKYMTHILP
jgi:hypothetical protein